MIYLATCSVASLDVVTVPELRNVMVAPMWPDFSMHVPSVPTIFGGFRLRYPSNPGTAQVLSSQHHSLKLRGDVVLSIVTLFTICLHLIRLFCLLHPVSHLAFSLGCLHLLFPVQPRQEV